MAVRCLSPRYQHGAALASVGTTLDREPTMLDPEAREKARVHGEAEAAATRALQQSASTSASTSPPPPPPTFGIVGDPAEAERCRELVSKALDRDEKVHTLREALTKLGVATGNMVHCEHCPDGLAAAGGYVPSERRVALSWKRYSAPGSRCPGGTKRLIAFSATSEMNVVLSATTDASHSAAPHVTPPRAIDHA